MSHEHDGDEAQRAVPTGPDGVVTAWASHQATPFRLDDDGIALPDAIAAATVVGLASAVRSARELVLATQTLLRTLVDAVGVPGAGVRAVSIEGTDPPFNTAADLDRWVTSGEGDVGALLRASQGFLHHLEAAAVLRWLRQYAVENPNDPVRVVHDERPSDTPNGLAELEQDLARRDLDWHQRTGQRIAHWGGMVHTVSASQRRLPGLEDETHRNAGGHLREALGSDYAVIALTIGTGSVPFFVPPTPSANTEAVLADSKMPVLLTLERLTDAPDPVRRWFRRPLRTRAIGPNYDASRDDEARVENGPTDECIDAIVYVPTATAVSPMPDEHEGRLAGPGA